MPHATKSSSQTPTFRKNQKFTLTHLTECTAAGNPDNTRLTIGIGEVVDLGGMPDITKWSVSGGLISTSNGVGTTFNASLSPSNGTVTATVEKASPLTVTFNVKAPSGLGDIYKVRDFGLGQLGIDQIGASTGFHFTMLPASVSFANMRMRENFPLSIRNWPNLDQSRKLPGTNYFPVRGNCSQYDGDDITDGPIPIDRLFDGTNFVDFSYPYSWSDEYQNASGDWVNFASPQTITKFRGSDRACQEIYQGVPGSWQGPWQ